MRLSDIYGAYLDAIERLSAEDWKQITLEAERHTFGESEMFDYTDNRLRTLTDYQAFQNGYNKEHMSIQIVHLHMTKQACDEVSYSICSGEGEVA